MFKKILFLLLGIALFLTFDGCGGPRTVLQVKEPVKLQTTQENVKKSYFKQQKKGVG